MRMKRGISQRKSKPWKQRWKLIQPAIAKAAGDAADSTLANLAAALGRSPSQAHTVLSAALGETPKEYTQRLRLDRAAGLILTTRLTLLDIALECGFESHEVFLRAFHRRFGLTPSACRKRGLAGDPVDHVLAISQSGPCLGLYHIDTRPPGTRKETSNRLMQYQIEQKDLAAQPVLIVRRRVPRSDIAMTIGKELRAVFVYAQANGIGISGHPITRYPEYSVGLVTLETGMRVTAHPGQWNVGESDGNVIRELLPAGPAVSTIHSGLYDGLPDAYAALEQWLAANGALPAGAPWEVYLTDPGDHPDPADWKTEVFWPIKAA